ncbi:unnamed protein product [Phaedon cochleariae]|uniref:Cuticle protein n=1 Tax=Phaedon cochleariae TaxID=80249 RepID=A0A9N9SI18_PHACE|nr:unnamed protein product [Phaedon cochleariae]
MHAQVVIALACLAVANAGPFLPSTKILQGPSSRTTLVGPDGSVISAAALGGQVITEEHPGQVGYAGPVVAAPALSYHSVPVVAHSSPIVAHASPVVAHSAHTDAVIAGPSGTIATGRSFVAGPVVAPWTAQPGHLIVPGSLEGQYVHDYTENLYDDGSYKPHLY